ncbi:MFS transporter [Streptococcus parasanguinis]|uniref:MFS transporter n=1 Tax=Streptococcus gingivalis TaxID=3111861 RepID=A0ABU6B615_9STRE|nr:MULTISPECIES: MFS transporter [Streptococcus]MCP9035022.1 MFS transporter [Streptococcus sp. CF8_Ac1-9]MCP9043665.1 MFS transporter [Streptococcus sp. CF8_Ac1-11]MEB3519251.1 MFS transporter [Streptococcus sp. S2(2023)]MTR53800.1 MFS transporter [Streptococcus parasanguinis]MTR55687.1 MFS transporter [Streptococcus parasanguinis]
MFKRTYKRNISLLAGLEFTSYFGITSFWILFFIQNGLSLLQIGLLESIFHGTSLLCEIPSGMLADRFSYKTNLYLARLSSIGSSILILFGQGNFWIYAIAMMVNAWSYNFDSGTSTAFLFDSAVEAGQKDRYLQISSFLSGVAEVTRTLGTVVAGFLIHGALAWTYYIAIGLSLISILLIFLMKEPESKSDERSHLTLKRILEVVKQEWQEKPVLFYWMLTYQLVGTIMCMFYFYYQQKISDLTSWQVSLIMLIGSGFNLLAVYLASQIGKKWNSNQVFPILVALTGLALFLVGLKTPFAYLSVYLLTNALYAVYQPIYYNDLQAYLPSSVRATMLSINSMMFSLSMIVIFPLTGWLIDTCGFVAVFLVLGLITFLSFPLLLIGLGRMGKTLSEVTKTE